MKKAFWRILSVLIVLMLAGLASHYAGYNPAALVMALRTGPTSTPEAGGDTDAVDKDVKPAGSHPDVAALAALPVITLRVRQTEGYEVAERHAGQVVAKRSSALGFSRGGLLSQIAVDEGDNVAAGDTLARLDTRALAAERDELTSELAESRSRLDVAAVRRDQATSVEERRRALARKDWVSQEAFDDAVFGQRIAVAEHQSAENAVRRVEAALARVQVAMDLSVLTAPYAGIIVARRADEGTAIGAGEPVLDLIEAAAMEFRVGVPEASVAALAVGSDYQASISGRELRCRLTRLLPQVDTETRTITAIFDLSDDDPRPLSGEIGHLVLARTIQAAGFWLPIAALTESRRGLWAAYAVESEGAAGGTIGTVSRRELQLIQTDGRRAYVTGVLEDGDRVVVEGVHRLAPGMRVRAVSADAVDH